MMTGTESHLRAGRTFKERCPSVTAPGLHGFSQGTSTEAEAIGTVLTGTTWQRNLLAAALEEAAEDILEQDDEWTVAERRYFSAEWIKHTTTPILSSTTQEILAAIA